MAVLYSTTHLLCMKKQRLKALQLSDLLKITSLRNHRIRIWPWFSQYQVACHLCCARSIAELLTVLGYQSFMGVIHLFHMKETEAILEFWEELNLIILGSLGGSAFIETLLGSLNHFPFSENFINSWQLPFGWRMVSGILIPRQFKFSPWNKWIEC